jgi:hypothetical protein
MSALEYLRKSAKRWLKGLRAGDADAHARLKHTSGTGDGAGTIRFPADEDLTRLERLVAANALDAVRQMLNASWHGRPLGPAGHRQAAARGRC